MGLLVLSSHSNIDCSIEDLVHTTHLLRRALHVQSTHFLRNSLALCLCDWGQTLCFEELDTLAFMSEVGFEAAEDYGCGWAEVEDFGVPLESDSTYSVRIALRDDRPCQARFRGNSGSRSRSTRRADRFQDKTVVVAGRILLGRQYPIMPAPHLCRTACARLV